jgi:cell division transport system permease protein
VDKISQPNRTPKTPANTATPAKVKKPVSQFNKRPHRIKRHYVTRARIVRYGLSSLKRNLWLAVAATAVMTITLLTVFVSGAASLALNGTVRQVKEQKSDLSVFMKADTPAGIIKDMKTKLLSDQNVEGVNYKTENAAASNQEMENLAEQLEISSEDTSLIQVTIRVKNIDNVDSVKKLVTSEPYVSYMDPDAYDSQFYNGDNTQIINTINNWARYAQIGGAVLGGVFLLISILVIFNTIRMAIFSRREEIEMEKSIGADRKFINGPFLVEAEFYGVIAGGLATAFGYAIIRWALPFLAKAGIVTTSLTRIAYGYLWLVIIGMILVGAIIGGFSARLAVRKYLKH